MTAKRKLIIDTDGVSDDIRAISLAMQHPDVEVGYGRVHKVYGRKYKVGGDIEKRRDLLRLHFSKGIRRSSETHSLSSLSCTERELKMRINYCPATPKSRYIFTTCTESICVYR